MLIFFSTKIHCIEFNKLVESTLLILETIVKNNMSKEDLEEFLTNVSIKLHNIYSKSKRKMTTRGRLLSTGKMNKQKLSKHSMSHLEIKQVESQT